MRMMEMINNNYYNLVLISGLENEQKNAMMILVVLVSFHFCNIFSVFISSKNHLMKVKLMMWLVHGTKYVLISSCPNKCLLSCLSVEVWIFSLDLFG